MMRPDHFTRAPHDPEVDALKREIERNKAAHEQQVRQYEAESCAVTASPPSLIEQINYLNNRLETVEICLNNVRSAITGEQDASGNGRGSSEPVLELQVHRLERMVHRLEEVAGSIHIKLI